MAVKSDRVEARVSPEERARLERAAAFSGESLSAFMVHAAVERADELIESATTTVAPAEFFEAVLAALDQPEPAPRLARAAQDASRRQRIRSA